jgi:hypothetical protein
MTAAEPDPRRWWLARARAETVERQLARDRTDERNVVALALDFMTLVESMHGWPPPRDPVSDRENEIVRATWKRMRRNWAARSRK